VTPPKTPANGPVDAVYTWAGGDDLSLRFSLRALQRYAPWIRKVHLVTGGDAPAWINPGDRLAVVRHENLFRERSALPTSNPDAIAWQFFRIPDLARQFLHFDADLLLGRALAREDFLTPKGGNRFFAESSDIPPGGTAEKLLNSRFGNRSPRKKPAQLPRFLDRNFLEEVNRLWEKPIKQGGVSMETLYFYYLIECPQQYGVHEQVLVTPEIFRSVPLGDAKQLAGLLFARPKFFRLDIADGNTPGLTSRVLLKLFHWRRSPFEK
jgi:hypothetical protein